MVEYRVRPMEVKIRCFQCHGYGHKASGYKETVRGRICMTCGLKGHVARNSLSPPNFVLREKKKKKADKKRRIKVN